MNIPEKIDLKSISCILEGTVDNSVVLVAENQNNIIDCLHELNNRLPKPEAPKRWRADQGDYWYVSDLGQVVHDTDGDFLDDNWRYNTGNYFRTQEEAEAYREELLAKGQQV